MFLISFFSPVMGFFSTGNLAYRKKGKGGGWVKIQTLFLHSHAEFHSFGFRWFTSKNSLLQDLKLNPWPKFALFGSLGLLLHSH